MQSTISVKSSSDIDPTIVPPSNSIGDPNSVFKSEVDLVKSSISAERWQTFHANSKILVVDDNARTASLLQAKLALLYQKVDSCTSAREAHDLIGAAAEEGKPYTAIVSDFLMPKQTGLEMAKALGEQLPAFVLHTASIAGANVLDLESAIGAFESAAFVERLSGMLKDGSVDKIAIFSHHKTPGSLLELVGKIDAAIGLNLRNPEFLREFIRDFNPAASPTTFPSEILHNFCEECRNLAEEVGHRFYRLKGESELTTTQWWSTEGVDFEKTLQQLAATRFSDNHAESPSEIASRLHDLLGPIYSLGLPEFERSQSSPFLKEEARELNSILAGYRSITDDLRNALLKHAAGEFFVDDFLIKLPQARYFGFREAYFCGLEGETQTSIKDADKQIRNLLSGLLLSYKAQAEAQVTASPHFGASYITEAYRVHESDELRQKLNKINCGPYVTFTFSQDAANWDSIFAKNVPALSDLVRTGKGFFDSSNASADEESRGFFKLLIKAGERTRDFEAESKARSVKNKDGYYQIERSILQINVWEDLGAAKNIVALMQKPEIDEAWLRNYVIFEHKDKIIVSYGSSHLQAALHIAHYLNFNGEIVGDFSGSSVQWHARNIYQEAGRISLGYNSASCDFSDDDARGQKFIKALVELGIPASQIEYDGYLASSKISS